MARKHSTLSLQEINSINIHTSLVHVKILPLSFLYFLASSLYDSRILFKDIITIRISWMLAMVRQQTVYLFQRTEPFICKAAYTSYNATVYVHW
jgi:hypothetical protein